LVSCILVLLLPRQDPEQSSQLMITLNFGSKKGQRQRDRFSALNSLFIRL
jgi:hypothetical protein